MGAMWSGAQEVAQEIKSAATANVAGTIYEKVFYKSVVALAIVLFIANSISVLHSAATEKVTDIQLTVLDSMPFPALWVCAPKESVNKFSLDLQADLCESPSVGQVGQVTFVEKKFGESAIKALTCSNATGSPDNDIIKGLLNFMNSTYGQADCFLIHDPSHVATFGEFQKLMFHVTANVSQEYLNEDGAAVLMGVLDGTKSWAEQKDSFGQGFLVLDVFSSNAEVKFSMDKFVDVPFSMFGIGGEANTRMSYYSTSSSARETPVNDVGHAGSTIAVSVGSFVVREITSRYKTFSAVCAEIGGVWTISVLVVTAFFVGKTVQGKEQMDPSVPVQVFRLRGLSSQKEACKEIALMLSDTKSAVQENNLDSVAGV